MEVDRPARATIRFGAFELDMRAGELQKAGVRIKLQEQPLQILRVLLENPGEVVTREEIQQRLWPSDTFVDFEHGLYNAIKRVREALGDSAENPQFIETVPKRGYRFIGSVIAANPNSDAAKKVILNEITPESRQLPWPAVIAVIAAFGTLMALVGLAGFKMRDRSPGTTPVTRIQSLAVLPLTNLSGDPAQEYFSDGMTDALITDLAQIGSVKVISRTSAMQYKQPKEALPEIARKLKVDAIVEGTVQHSGGRVRITAQLIQASTDRHLWAKSFERDTQDVFALEREVAEDITRELQVQVTSQTQAPLPRPRSVNPKALEAYLQANSHMYRFSRGSGDQQLRLASQFYREAIDADPNFALAYVGMANAHFGTMQSSDEDVELARSAAEKAVELDPALSDAWDVLGDLKGNSWDWAGAEKDYRRALALNPSNADAHDSLCGLLDDLGRLDAGWEECQIAQQLDPNHDHLEYTFYKRHDYDRAIEAVLTMLGSDPNNGTLHHQLYENYSAKGMYKEAIEQLERTVTLFGFPKTAVKLRRAYATSGYSGAMREYATELEHFYKTNQIFMPVNIATVYAALGDKDRAFYWLEQGYKRRGHCSGVPIMEIKVYPGLDPLRSDPRFTDLLRRMGLAP